MRIAVLAHSFIRWSGGRDFLSTTIHALYAAGQKQPLDIYLIIPRNPGLSHEEISPTVEWISHHGRSANIVGYTHSSNQDIINCLDQIKADVVIPSMLPLGKEFPYPWVGYLYDFQHKYYPALFSQDELEGRQKFFEQMLSEAKAVIVNSRAVKEDVYKYYPDTSCRIFDLPFSPCPEASWLDQKDDISQKYNVPEKYFIICNQFWVHKDHETAVEALAILKQKRDLDTVIVCTGTTHDHRCPDYIDRLSKKIKEWNLQNNILILGHIPKADQLQLMHKAMAAIQPTLFEGGPGGGSVREAVALGVPVIVSDIPVNREIGDDKVTFFKAGSAIDLAEKMERVLRLDQLERPDKSVLLERGRTYAEAKGERLMAAIAYVREAYRNSNIYFSSVTKEGG